MFCIFVRRPVMPRKGWRSVAIPDGWAQVIRGPRPPAAKWPRTQKQPHPSFAGGHQRPQMSPSKPQSTKVRSLEATLVALGPEDSTAKLEVETALRRAEEHTISVTRTDPDTRVALARERGVQVGKGPRSDEGSSRCRGRKCAHCIEASAERCPRSLCGSSNPRAGVFRREGTQELLKCAAWRKQRRS